MRQYKIIYDSETLIRKIDNLITIQVENKWYHHFRYVLKYFWDDENENILGKTYSESFCIWQYNYRWGGIFYPIVFGTIVNKNGSTILELKTKLNACGKFLSVIVFLGMMIGAIYSNIIKINNEIYFNFKIILLALIVSILFQSVPLAAYNLTRIQTIRFIQKFLSLENSSIKTKPS
jgi:hypothetical protein